MVTPESESGLQSKAKIKGRWILRKVIRCLAGIVLIAFAAPTAPQAEPVPEYTGVYIRLEDGRLVELPRITFERSSYEIQSTVNTFLGQHFVSSVRDLRRNGYQQLSDLSGNAGELKVSMRGIAPGDGISAWPQFNVWSNSPKSIVVRQRNPKATFVEQLVSMSDFWRRIKAHPGAASLSLPTYNGDILIGYDWGCSTDVYHEKLIDQFTTEYVFGGTNCDLNSLFETPGPFKKEEMSVKAWVIHSDGGYYAFRFF